MSSPSVYKIILKWPNQNKAESPTNQFYEAIIYDILIAQSNLKNATLFPIGKLENLLDFQQHIFRDVFRFSTSQCFDHPVIFFGIFKDFQHSPLGDCTTILIDIYTTGSFLSISMVTVDFSEVKKQKKSYVVNSITMVV